MILQCEEIPKHLKTTNGHTIRNVLERQQCFIDDTTLISTPSPRSICFLAYLIQLDLSLVQLPLILAICMCLLFHLRKWPKVKCGQCNPRTNKHVNLFLLHLWYFPTRQNGPIDYERKIKVKINNFKIFKKLRIVS